MCTVRVVSPASLVNNRLAARALCITAPFNPPSLAFYMPVNFSVAWDCVGVDPYEKQELLCSEIEQSA
jgi:hypothetical protein